MLDTILITSAPLDLAGLLASIGHPGDGPAEEPEAGALVTFSGIVRRMEEGRPIPGLDYEHYAGMAEQELARLAEQAHARWKLHAVLLAHRIGPVPVGEASVIVAVSAGHRAEAFDAARYLIDTLKQSVPIWKAAPAAEP